MKILITGGAGFIGCHLAKKLIDRGDIRKLRKLGWKPTTRIEKGIKNFVEWYKDYYKVK